jgi:DHA1 family tetracycline resistance protein-like MFS transporter
LILRLLPILGITFVDILGFSILIPLMPFYVKRFGAPDVVVGALFASFAFCQFVAGPIWGNVSDRVGRKIVLIVSQIGATVGWTMLAFAPTIPFVFLARIIEGFSGGNISVTQAYVSDLVEPAQRARAFAYIGAAFSMGIVFGPMAGGVLVERYGFAVPFLFAAGLQAITLLLTITILPESRRAAPDEKPAALGDVGRALGDRRVGPVLWQKLAFALGLYGWFAVFTLVLQRQFGLNAAQASFFYVAFGFANLVVQLGVVGRLTDKLGDRRASLLGFASLLVAFALVPLSHNIVPMVLMVIFFSLGLSVVNSTIPSILSALAPDNLRGTVLGVSSALDSISGVVMPVITTFTLQAAGVPPTVAIPFGLVAVALAMGARQLARGAAASTM